MPGGHRGGGAEPDVHVIVGGLARIGLSRVAEPPAVLVVGEQPVERGDRVVEQGPQPGMPRLVVTDATCAMRAVRNSCGVRSGIG